MTGNRFALLLPLCAALILAAPACRTSTRSSGLPAHIRTVEVEMFGNDTTYYGMEGKLTRRIIDQINADAVIKVSSRGGDAVITGEILKVSRRTVRETTTNEPATVVVVVEARYSFYDEVERRYIREDVSVSSAQSSSTAGMYELDRNELSSDAEDSALAALAREVVRGTIGRW